MKNALLGALLLIAAIGCGVRGGKQPTRTTKAVAAAGKPVNPNSKDHEEKIKVLVEEAAASAPIEIGHDKDECPRFIFEIMKEFRSTKDSRKILRINRKLNTVLWPDYITDRVRMDGNIKLYRAEKSGELTWIGAGCKNGKIVVAKAVLSAKKLSYRESTLEIMKDGQLKTVTLVRNADEDEQKLEELYR